MYILGKIVNELYTFYVYLYLIFSRNGNHSVLFSEIYQTNFPSNQIIQCEKVGKHFFRQIIAILNYLQLIE